MNSFISADQFHPEIGSGGLVPWPAEKIRTDVGPVSQPTIARGPDGELIAHGSRVGTTAARIFHSTDGGTTWKQLCEMKVDYGPRPDFYSSPDGCGYLKDGTILLTYSHQFNAEGKYVDPYHDPTHGLRTFVIRSTDHGRNWSDPVELDPWPFEGIGCDSTRIHQGPDGTVFLPMGGHRFSRPGKPLTRPEQEHDLTLLFTSQDSGRTWRTLSYLGAHVCEFDLLALDSDLVLAAARFQRSKKPYDPKELVSPYYLDEGHRKKRGADCPNCKDPAMVGGHSVYKQTALLRSYDGGRTWTKPYLITGWLQQTGCLVALPDGTLVLPFSHKDQNQGQRFIVSYDLGETWSRTVFDLNEGGMYASSVALPDGAIVTVHDQKGTGNLQVLRWRVPPKSRVEQGGFFKPRPVDTA